MFKAPTIIPDDKYFDSFNTWYQYDNSPLRENKGAQLFSIASVQKEGHPRLLMVSVDVMDDIG